MWRSRAWVHTVYIRFLWCSLRVIRCRNIPTGLASSISIGTVTDKWVPVTTAWRALRLRMEERLPIWRVATKIYIEIAIADKGWSSSLGVVLTTHHRKKFHVVKLSKSKPRTCTDTLVQPKQLWRMIISHLRTNCYSPKSYALLIIAITFKVKARLYAVTVF